MRDQQPLILCIPYACVKADFYNDEPNAERFVCYSNLYVHTVCLYAWFMFKVLEEPVPDDRYHGIYFAMLLAGVGFLLPYNSFITEVDYLHHKFEGRNFPV